MIQEPYETEKRPEEHNCSKDECVKMGYQYANVSSPIQLKPNIKIGDIDVECCNEPVVECCDCKCDSKCEITITQKVCIKIPICYEIDACVGESVIDCECGKQ